MEDERNLLIMFTSTMILLMVDLGYRATVKPRDVSDLLVVIGGVLLCALVVFLKLERNIQRPFLIVVISTLALLIGDFGYRAIVQPQDFYDLLIVMVGMALCGWVTFPKLLKNVQAHEEMVLGAALGAVLVISGLILYTNVTGNPVDWGKHLSSLLGVLTPFVLVWILARVTRRGKS